MLLRNKFIFFLISGISLTHPVLEIYLCLRVTAEKKLHMLVVMRLAARLKPLSLKPHICKILLGRIFTWTKNNNNEYSPSSGKA